MAGILLVHGGWHGPWCWDHFVKHLTALGHNVQTVRLRGHDRPPGRIWHRIRDYVEDVRTAMTDLPEPPLLVGHSIGALVVQKYLERDAAMGAVLMAPFPPTGTMAAVARLSLRHPIVLLKTNLFLRLTPFIDNVKLVRELFFTHDTPQEVVDHCLARLQDESYLAFVDTMLVLPRPTRVQVPVLVLAAERDAFFTVAEVQRTARAYRTRAEIFPGIGHDMMLEESWPKQVDRIDAWIRELSTISAYASRRDNLVGDGV